jgi:PIN domain nuclease of toxin-antitoxin system
MVAEPARLSDATRDLLADVRNELLLSAVSSWEIAIKYRLGKLPLPKPPNRFIPELLRLSGTVPLAIEHDHTLRVADLPDHHRDPFDRLIVAQAQCLDVPIVTADQQLSAYDVSVVLA